MENASEYPQFVSPNLSKHSALKGFFTFVLGKWVFNEVDTLESSSILIYSHSTQAFIHGEIGRMPSKLKW